MERVLLGAALASSLLSSGVKQNQELSVWKTLPLPFTYLFFGSKVQTQEYRQKNFDTKNQKLQCTLRTLPAKFIITVGFILLTQNPPAAGIGCFKCVSVNGSLPACEDQFHNNKTDMVSKKQSRRYLKTHLQFSIRGFSNVQLLMSTPSAPQYPMTKSHICTKLSKNRFLSLVL